jgi:hypothetical protein
VPARVIPGLWCITAASTFCELEEMSTIGSARGFAPLLELTLTLSASCSPALEDWLGIDPLKPSIALFAVSIAEPNGPAVPRAVDCPSADSEFPGPAFSTVASDKILWKSCFDTSCCFEMAERF